MLGFDWEIANAAHFENVNRNVMEFSVFCFEDCLWFVPSQILNKTVLLFVSAIYKRFFLWWWNIHKMHTYHNFSMHKIKHMDLLRIRKQIRLERWCAWISKRKILPPSFLKSCVFRYNWTGTCAVFYLYFYLAERFQQSRKIPVFSVSSL